MIISTLLKNFLSIGITLTTLTVIGLSTSASARAQVLLEDNFNSENSGVPTLNYYGFTNWNVTSGSVDLIGNGYFDLLPGNGLYVDTDGSTLQPSAITSKQTFSFNPGDTVNLTFDLAGDQRDTLSNTVDVSLGSLFNQTFTLPANQGFTQFSETIPVTAATSANLEFQSVTGANIGLLLDNVNLSKNVTLSKSVPESSFMIGLIALGSFGAVSLLKHKQSQI